MKEKYFAYAKKIADQYHINYEENVSQAVSRAIEIKNNSPLANLVYLAMVDALQYQVSGDIDYARRSKKALLDLGCNKKAFEEMSDFNNQFSFKVMDYMFMPNVYIRTYIMLKESGVFTEEEHHTIAQNVEEAIEPIFAFPEWGSHNRAVVRAMNLLLASKYFPDNRHSSKWKKMGEYLMEESFGKWTIEDGSTYHPVWLNAIFVYEENCERKDLFDSPMIKYYAEFFSHMLPPSGIYPEFGDGRYGTVWGLYVSCLERLAAIYQNGHYKYAAEKMFSVLSELDPGTAPLTLKMAHSFVEAYLWADDTVLPLKPDYKSEEALCDTIGKKIIFRSGVNENDTYLLLNYRDETATNRLGQYYLRNTIPVHSEKTHHGHSDENSICHYEHNGIVMLHDGGYRWRLFRDGEWRADYFHNSVVVRRGRFMENQPFFTYLNDGGDYKRTRTEKVYFSNFSHLDVSRTRNHILDYQTIWDRSICYFKRERIFLIVDTMGVTSDGSFMYSPIFFGGNCEKLDENSYLTNYDFIGSDEFVTKIPNKGGKLHIRYIGNSFKTGTETVGRSYTEETALYRFANQDMFTGAHTYFVTLLCPDDCMNDRIDAKITYQEDDGISICVTSSESEYHLCFKSKDELGKRNSINRPTYSYDRSKVSYDTMETDSVFSFVEKGNENSFGLLAGTRLDFESKTLFSAPEGMFMQNDYSWDSVASLWIKWEDTF
ncbi:MAG: hypothetical protein JXQ23_04290 [Clostridia bacterium]|nr:hypothetical protein [Clostridia bacterium]